jgi:hypothetical protein
MVTSGVSCSDRDSCFWQDLYVFPDCPHQCSDPVRTLYKLASLSWERCSNFASDSKNKLCFNVIRISASNLFQIFHILSQSSRINKLSNIADITVRDCAEISYSGTTIIPVAKLIPLLRYFTENFVTFISVKGYAIEALRYKPEGRGFDSRRVIAIFHWHNPSGHTMVLGLIHPLTELSNRIIFRGVKGNRYLELTTLPHSCADCLEIW